MALDNQSPTEIERSSYRQFVQPLWHHGLLPDGNVPAIELTRGAGIYLWDATGKRYIDGWSSSGPAALGHGRVELAEAAYDQMKSMAFFPNAMGFSNQSARLLSERLLDIAGCLEGAVWFSTSGSEAIETAMKIALHYHRNRGEADRRMFLTCLNGFHGNTLGAAAATGSKEVGFFFPAVAASFEQLPATPHESSHESEAFLAVLAESIARIGAKNLAGFIAEPIPVGGGVRVPITWHWSRVKELLSENGILMIADEVLTGFGRTGTMFSQQHYGINADLVTLSKGITSGYLPLSACVTSASVAAEFDNTGARALRHRGTYSGHATSCAVALRSLELIQDERLPENAIAQGVRLKKGLERIASRPGSLVGRPTGKGLLISVPVYRREPGDASSASEFGATEARMLHAKCIENGLILGKPGLPIGFWPPLTVTADEVDEILDIFGESVDALESSSRAIR